MTTFGAGHDLRIGEGPIVGEERIEINVVEVHSWPQPQESA